MQSRSYPRPPNADGTANQVLATDGAGQLSFVSGGGGGTPTDITVANEATDTSCFLAFFTAATGDLGPKTNANLPFNSSSGVLTLTSPSIGDFQNAVHDHNNDAGGGTLDADAIFTVGTKVPLANGGTNAGLFSNSELIRLKSDGTAFESSGKTAPTGDIVGTSDTQTLSGKTLTAPKFATAGFIADANGNELIKFPSTVASAVNELTVSNAATLNAVVLETTGSDSNIELKFLSKGTGGRVRFQIGSTVELDITPGLVEFTSNLEGLAALFGNNCTARSFVANNVHTAATGEIAYGNSSTASGSNAVSVLADDKTSAHVVWLIVNIEGTDYYFPGFDKA